MSPDKFLISSLVDLQLEISAAAEAYLLKSDEPVYHLLALISEVINSTLNVETKLEKKPDCIRLEIKCK